MRSFSRGRYKLAAGSQLMVAPSTQNLPVIDKYHHLLGIIAREDVMRALAHWLKAADTPLVPLRDCPMSTFGLERAFSPRTIAVVGAVRVHLRSVSPGSHEPEGEQLLQLHRGQSNTPSLTARDIKP